MAAGTKPLYERYYYSRPEFVGGTTQFHQLIARHATGGEILEIGSGPENQTTKFLATLGRVVGADVAQEPNPYLAEFHLLDGHALPFRADRFELCVANYVIEHIPDPRAHFAEIARVLRPGGAYVFRTPNLFHYVTLGSALLHHRFHLLLANWLRAKAPGAHDPWPTVYMANTPAAIRRLARDAGLDVETLELVEKEPSYGAATPLLFYPMMCYERVVNGVPTLAALRANLFVALNKRS